MIYDVIIIGAGCAGLTAAVYAARAGKSTLILEAETVGGQISSSPRVENFPSIKTVSGMAFSDNLFTQATDSGAEFSLEKVSQVIDGNPKTVVTGDGSYQGKSVIVATGVKHMKLGVSGEPDFDGKGISYCAVCDGGFYKDGTIAVVGGGDAAFVNALYLTGLCKKVYLIHRRDEFRAELANVDELKSKANVEWVLSSNIIELKGNSTLSEITVENAVTKEKRGIAVDGLFVCVGYAPENKIFEGLLTLDGAGYIVASEDCKTNIEGIYAAGDCRTKSVRQLTTAAADGAVAALSAI